MNESFDSTLFTPQPGIRQTKIFPMDVTTQGTALQENLFRDKNAAGSLVEPSSAKSARIVPMIGANLKPCRLKPAAITIDFSVG